MGDSTEFARKLITPYAERIEELEEEVERLRELVRDMYGNYRVGWNEEIEDELYDRMRELGVEVEDD